jgi:hypothetical protein
VELGVAKQNRKEETMRNLKALGLALVAVVALSAMAASTASAQTNGMLTSDSSPVWIHGEDEPNTTTPLTAFGGTTECAVATYSGGKINGTTGGTPKHHEGLVTPASSFTLTPKYSGCLASGVLPETITMNGCDYVIHIGPTVGASNDLYSVTADLVCPENQEVTIDIFGDAGHTVPVCTIHIPPQAGLTGGTLTDEPTSDHITLGGTIGGITMTKTKGAAGVCDNHEHTSTGALDLAVTLAGKSAATNGSTVGLGITH